MRTDQTIEPPQNGLPGLKHWRYDLLAGFVVSLVSLPLSSGIAIASGAPPIFGIISSVIAGLIFPFVGGSFVTISGPAAGLAPALLAIMAALGGAGTADSVGAGYPLLLVVIFCVGLAQLAMARMGLARFAGVFPASIVEGMLGAIGLLILVKALPLFFGVLDPGHPHGFFEYVASVPRWFEGRASGPFAIGVVSLVVMLVASSSWARKLRFFEVVPPHIFAVAVGVSMALVMNVAAENPAFLIVVPADPLSGIQLPAFSKMLSHSELWYAAAVGAVTLTLIDGVESLATAQAIDRIDPFQRKSNPNRLLAAMGISNVLSSLVGGLTIIPGGVKSKTCIEAGGRTLWANFVNAMCLLVFLFIAPGLISLIPKATLGAILVYTGWKMIHPSIARHLAHVGKEQVVLYAFTIFAILCTDLLVGVLVGTAAKMLFLSVNVYNVSKQQGMDQSFWTLWKGMFLNPVTDSAQRGSSVVLTIDRPLDCFNSYLVHEHIASLPDEVASIEIRLGIHSAFVDHTALDGIMMAIESSRDRTIRIEGLDRMDGTSEHDKSMHIRNPRKWIQYAAAGTAAAAVAFSSGAAFAHPEPPNEVEDTKKSRPF